MLPIIVEEQLEELEPEDIDITQLLKKSYETVHNDLMVGSVTNAEFSGTTLCSVLLKGRNLYAANVGDSRAILVTAENEVFQLTKD